MSAIPFLSDTPNVERGFLSLASREELENRTCPICQVALDALSNISFHHNGRHPVHTECLDEYLEFKKNHGEAPLCPSTKGEGSNAIEPCKVELASIYDWKAGDKTPISRTVERAAFRIIRRGANDVVVSNLSAQDVFFKKMLKYILAFFIVVLMLATLSLIL